jgi:hypothetical protein
MLPCGLLAGTTGLMLVPVFWVAAVTELYDGSLNYSLQQTTKEVLYLPIDRSIRYKVKPFIDMVVFRFGKGIAAITGIVLLDMLHMPARHLSLIAIPLIVGWIIAAVWLRRDYVTRIRTILQARADARRAQEAAAESRGEGRTAEPDWTTDGHPTARKLALLDQAMGTRESRVLYAAELMSELSAYETPQTQLQGAPDHAAMKAIIGNQREPMGRRCQAIRALVRSADQETVDYLFALMMVEVDAVLRQEAVRGLVQLRLHGAAFEFPVAQIRRQVMLEIANHQRIIRVGQAYGQRHSGPIPSDDPLLGLLRILTEESVEQVFRLLMLIYRAEDIHLVYEQFRTTDTYLRADAIELLDNLVDPAMRAVLLPLMDEDRFLSSLEDRNEGLRDDAEVCRLLQGAIWDHHYWLSITALCAAGRLRMSTMRGELERASRHATPVISAAAKVALELSVLS